ncbi:LEAF RUST 10 DISEASE-RESISTANCE LOCUS RECEPTOR-LIKE PROTEIN KINASE-like 2.5 [Iris pallida]|uniref:LEAF RUST 10 DISEASE-RESISTANCE LOCUS RECEPTOR-LIKE PROTEIN KINASE-like 2.5 n=1 Tax=Iris pallida TaxID=29817 RepID=A0AAX6FNV3_IRIPA|nr:LEAF RUST 10 DISEASE-RESISTANCE LOCUS RECEPTOR-LIKE PROTEIN KINASE-like 2.5 [Iris pallida]
MPFFIPACSLLRLRSGPLRLRRCNHRLPFRVDTRHDYCGYPNLNLSCTSNDANTLTITISNKNFRVTSIDYDNHLHYDKRLLYLVNTAFVRLQSCSQPNHNITVDPNLFRLSDQNTNLNLFINCTASSSSIPNIYAKMCLLSVTGQHSHYRLNNSTMNDDALGRCSSTVVVPMAHDAAARMVNGELGFGEVPQEGFSVNWPPGMGRCSNCVSSGGRCGYNGSSPVNIHASALMEHSSTRAFLRIHGQVEDIIIGGGLY